MGRREGPAEERRSAIVAAAREVFARQGYAGASIREIARQAGVSSALLYWFFPDKAALLIETLKSNVLVDERPVFLPERLLDQAPEAVISFVALHYLNTVSQPQQLDVLRLLLSEGQRDPALIGRMANEILGRALQPFSQYIAQQIELGRMRGVEPELAAQALFGMLIGVILRRDILHEETIKRFSNEQITAAVADIFLHGVAGPAADLSELKNEVVE